MDLTKQYQEQQEAKRLQNRISSFMGSFKVGTLLNNSGIQKLRGVQPLTLFTVIFMLPFEGVNFSRGIVKNPGLGFKKDAAYDFLRNPRHNWRKFMLVLATTVVRFFDLLTDEKREKVLIFDDSTYDRSRSKVVELLAWIHDHNSGRNLKGFKLLTLGWSDGVNFLPLDFVLCSSAKANKRVQGIRKELDKRTCGYKRRIEAVTKSTAPYCYPAVLFTSPAYTYVTSDEDNGGSVCPTMRTRQLEANGTATTPFSKATSASGRPVCHEPTWMKTPTMAENTRAGT